MESVDKKLNALVKLQKIDSQLDEIKKVRGDLPEEVRDLEDDIAGFETRVGKYDSEISELEKTISNHKDAIKNSEALIVKYTDQQMKVRNNREYDAITKEMELQALEMKISEKRINEAGAKIDFKKIEVEKAKEALADRKIDLEKKNEELSTLVAESEEDEKALNEKRLKAIKPIEERLLFSYDRIRGNAKNGLAVVTVSRNACGGCFNTVPPQRQSDINDRKKLIVCEHCGRILADVVFVLEEAKPKRKVTRTKKTTKKAAADK